jgi:hypothetical protein
MYKPSKVRGEESFRASSAPSLRICPRRFRHTRVRPRVTLVTSEPLLLP